MLFHMLLAFPLACHLLLRSASVGAKLTSTGRYAPHAVPHAAGFSSGLSLAPHAVPQAAGFSSGLSLAPHAAGFSPAPHAVPQAELVAASFFLLHPKMFDNAIILTSCIVICGLVPSCRIIVARFYSGKKYALFYYIVTFL